MPKYDDWLTPESLLKIEGWARDGLTDEQISENMGISTSTLYEWKKKFSDISESLKKGKEVVDRQVENALLKRALGYSYNETKVQDTADGTFTTITTKEVVPDVTAQIYWLKNRKPQQWRDKPGEERMKKLVELLGKLNFTQDEIDELLEEFDAK